MEKIKLTYKIAIMLLLLTVLLNACWWLFTSKPTYDYVDQETKDYCLFGEGSHWIFQDSVTLAIDSVVIDEPGHYEIKVADNGSESDAYYISFSLYSQNSSFRSRSVLLSHFYTKQLSVLSTEFGKIYHSGDILIFYNYLKEILLIEKKNSYSTNGFTYSNVKVFKTSKDEKEKVFYWAKHIGLIRIEVYENESLISVKNLIRYNVKPYIQ